MNSMNRHPKATQLISGRTSPTIQDDHFSTTCSKMESKDTKFRNKAKLIKRKHPKNNKIQNAIKNLFPPLLYFMNVFSSSGMTVKEKVRVR